MRNLEGAAARDGSGRDWPRIREALAAAIYEEDRPGRLGSTRTVYRVRPDVAAALAAQCIYIEQGQSGGRILSIKQPGSCALFKMGMLR